MTREDLEFAIRVDELGAQGKSQDQIAEIVGLSKNQIRHRLFRLGLNWERETRVRAGLTSDLLSDLVASGKVVAEGDEPAAADDREEAGVA